MKHQLLPKALDSTALAMVWRGGTSFEPTVMEVPQLLPGESLVRLSTSTICQSDRHTLSGHRDSPCPSVLGHEGVGRIVASNEGTDCNGTPLAEGDRVVWSVIAACGHCDRCESGLKAKCRHLQKVGHEPITSSWALSGTYASHMVLRPGQSVIRIDDHLPDPIAATAGCAAATVIAAFDAVGCHTLGSAALAGKRVLIQGVGMLGLYAVQAAQLFGANEIIAADPNPTRLGLARRWGATTLPAVHRDDLRVDLALDFSGAPQGVEAAIQSLGIGATAVLVGSVFPSPATAIDPQWLVRGWRSIRGVHNYEPHHLGPAVELLKHCAAQQSWDGVFGTTTPLRQIATCFSQQHQSNTHRPLRSIIDCQ
ncbi:zinc-binding dehydrogenase [Corynebacterium pseudopelargi]|uniref:alcohol dehydrogenase n=1 Tax=Corynebacterium pseudopelargi TaxID=2080757 RepID=A0A3G6IW21_9CORY|nr:zinc-binding dehydrogenase [Corynebacterium pseudopelargi]AZA09985.1 L-threonine 3-dehydrogenase [Corynebacterium pseudopelargi]